MLVRVGSPRKIPEIENVLTYLDAVIEQEAIPQDKRLLFFGFSQGVSIITRYIVKRKIKPASILLYAGSIPNELTQEDFTHLDLERTQIKMIYGNQDHFLTPKRIKSELTKLEHLFKGQAEVIEFKGGHELRPEILEKLSS